MFRSLPPDATKRTIAPNAATGTLATHDAAIFPNTLKSTALAPPARPTPTTAPTSVCVVETGTAKNGIEKISIVVAAPNSAAKPRVGVISVIFLPIVSITLQPQVITPIAMPAEPSKINHRGIGASSRSWPPSLLSTCHTAAIGPIALERSFAPWANATYAAVIICSQTNIRSTPLNPLFSSLISTFVRT